MPNIGWSEMLLIVAVLLLVVGPKELPRMLRTTSKYVRQARKIANEFRSTLEAAIYDDEVKEIQKELKQHTDQLNKSFADANPELNSNPNPILANGTNNPAVKENLKPTANDPLPTKGTHNPATLAPPINPKPATPAPMPNTPHKST